MKKCQSFVFIWPTYLLIGCANKNMLFNIIIHVSLFKIPEIIPYSLLEVRTLKVVAASSLNSI
jgi:hypothetical protein